MTTHAKAPSTAPLGPLLVSAGLAVCLLWAYWPTFLELSSKWRTDAQYSHGYLVPVFAAGLLWLRRDRLTKAALRPSWTALPVLAVALALHLAGAALYFDFLSAVSLLPLLAGLCLLLGGRPALNWAGPAILFLFFMIPLPFAFQTMLGLQLRDLATVASTYTLQTVGIPAVSEYHRIYLENGPPLDVAAACSGLSMMMTFFALSTAVAIVIDRPLLDRLVVLASAIPISLVANIARIVITAVLYDQFPGKGAPRWFFHDGAGYFMMVLGLLLLWAELALLRRLLLPRTTRDPAAPVPLPLRVASAGPRPNPAPEPQALRPGAGSR